jgi:hypothetical protein
MKRFPNLTSITWNQGINDILPENLSDLIVIPTCPAVKCLNMSTNVAIIPELTSAIIKACPNLTSLECQFPWILEGLSDILTSCPNLAEMRVECPAEYQPTEIMIEELVLKVAKYGSSLKLFKIFYYCSTDKKLNLRADKIQPALKSIVSRLHHFDINVDVIGELADISGLFETDIDLRYLDIRTYNGDGAMIAKILNGCHDVRELHLFGYENISQVIGKVASSCPQLETVSLLYNGRITGPMMRSLLQSCTKLAKLTLRASIDLLAYESLALDGSNLATLELLDELANPFPDHVDLLPLSQSFPSSSLILDPNFKQNRRHKMEVLALNIPIFINIKHLASFLSCFGKIGKLHLNIPYPTTQSMDTDELRGIPIFLAEDVTFRYTKPEGLIIGRRDFAYDHMFLALMNSCRSLKSLHAAKVPVKASMLITLAYMCHQRKQPLASMTCSCVQDMQDLKHSLPYIYLS